MNTIRLECIYGRISDFKLTKEINKTLYIIYIFGL